MDLINVTDCTGANLPHVTPPLGQKMAGYVTGTNGVAWTPGQWADHPDAIRIDQSPVNTPADELADVLDVETGAATPDDAPSWVRAARSNYLGVVRPGQRSPLVYVNRSNVTAVANALSAAQPVISCGLWLAAPMARSEAETLVLTASGPFPIIGVQYSFQSLFDVSVFNGEWFRNVSRNAPEKPPAAPYAVRFQRYQDGFGWVQDGVLSTHSATRYRVMINIPGRDEWHEINL